MKKILLSILCMGMFSSCCTIFTSPKQTITFVGENGTKIYDGAIKIAEIKEDGTASVRIRKSISDKYLIAKKEGYRLSPLRLETKFNAVALVNLLFWPGFIVDLATGQISQWDNTSIEIDMEKLKD